MRDSDHHLFYSTAIENETIILDESESRHAVSVLRIKIGEDINITDGNGTIYECECVSIDKRSISCAVKNKTYTERLTPELTLLAGLPDKDHFETILEHAAALGVGRVVPIVMDHCRKPWWEAWEKSRERFTAKMIVSMKQCLYPYIPQLDAPTTLADALDTCDKPIITADQNGNALRDGDLSSYKKLSCLIGPPGGFSASEQKLLGSQNSLTVNIAPTRLRTELAATVMCSRIMGSGVAGSI